MVESVYLAFVFLVTAVGLGIAGFAWRAREQSGARPLVAFALAASAWTLLEGLVMAQQPSQTMATLTRGWLSVSVVLPAAWLAFALAYTGSEWLTWRTGLALVVEPLAFLALVWTADSHGLVYSATDVVAYGDLTGLAVAFEVGFWAHLSYSYLLYAAGGVLIVRLLAQSNRMYRWQGTALIGAMLTAMATNALASFGLLAPGLDPSGIVFVFASFVLAVVVLQEKLVGVAPATREVGREAVLSNLDDAIFILDDGDRIVDANPAGEGLLDGSLTEALGTDIAEVDPALAAALADDHTQLQLEREGRVRYYDVRTATLAEESRAFAGRVLSLRDVTERRQREQRLDVLNRLLRHNVRNELNLARGKIELAELSVDDESASDHLEDATDAIDGIVARSDKLGRLSRTLDAEAEDAIDLAAELRGERETGGLSHPGGTVTLALPETLWVAGGSSLVPAIEELVANGIEHNDSADPHVEVWVDEEASDEAHAVLAVGDNGPGVAEQELATLDAGEETPLQHSSGVGLWLVTWVVQRIGGTVSFDTGEGTTVRLTLPRADGEN